MADSLSKCVVDTSLLIDLHIGKIIVKLFDLPYSFIAPDVIIAEAQTIDTKTLIRYGLQKSELAGEQILKVLQLKAQHRHPSVNDLFALVTAQSMNAVLLTGDRNLRKVAELYHVPVHGTLWILDEMVRLEIISSIQAISTLKSMCEQGSRLPQDECDRRLQNWQKNTH
ncbi:MAG TPA: PIN domain-containing protein [Ktedonobacteraceae bacterium]|nr:PIN domain-containing protein [Ktedonobacteraceae bacterium]